MSGRTHNALAIGLLSAAAAGSALAAAPADSAPTFTRDVAPILQERCQGCHRPDQIAPMPLRTYDEVRPWAKSIKRQVASRKMPPWFAHPDSRAMKGDMNLSDQEIETILAWVDRGAPMGDPAAMPPPREFVTFAGGWHFEDPDLVLEPAAPFTVGKDEDDRYQCFFIPLGVEHDLWMKAAEFQPDNTEVVHHFILFGDEKGIGSAFDEATPEAGWECGQMDTSLVQMKILQMWAPGNVAPMSPNGVGRRIAAGSHLVLQIHYHNETGEEQVDRSRFALHLAGPEETIQKELRGQLVSAWVLDIKAGDPNAEHSAEWTTPEDITVYSTGVHMHYRGKNMGLWATKPSGERETLIWVPYYDFNWQLSYEFVEPYHAPRGTLFRMVSHHDNSENNPFNPVIPPIDVKWGLKSTDEMSFAGISYTLDGEQLGITPELPAKTRGAAATGGL